MTDIMKLIEEACSTAAKYELENYYGTSKDYTAMCKVEAGEAQRALQSAIEALQGENERLKPVVEKWKDECHRVQALFEKETLRASELHEKVEQINAHRNHIIASNDKLRAERDALAAKLDELQLQEPVAWLHFDKAEANYGRFPWMLMVNQDHSLIAAKTKRLELHAAPKALEPLSYVEIEKARKQWLESGEMGTAYHSAVKFAERHHGITKGTPT